MTPHDDPPHEEMSTLLRRAAGRQPAAPVVETTPAADPIPDDETDDDRLSRWALRLRQLETEERNLAAADRGYDRSRWPLTENDAMRAGRATRVVTGADNASPTVVMNNFMRRGSRDRR